MIKALVNGGIIEYIISSVCMLPGIVIGLCMHEFAHAFVADKCGDPTPGIYGRVTVNPMAHIDPIGFLALILVHFGWGKPVIVNPSNFKHQRRDSVFVAIAGVTMNFVIATCTGLLFRLAISTSAGLHLLFMTSAGSIISDIWLDIVVINYGLMFFNLLPVPPLDGFNIVSDIFKLRGTRIWNMAYRYGSLILLAILIADIPSFLITKPLNWLVNLVCFYGL